MSRRVYGWDQNPSTDRFVYRCSNTSAQAAILDGFAEEIVDGDGRVAIRLRAPSQGGVLGGSGAYALSASIILQFIRTHCQGSRLNYEMPMAGDRGMRRYGLFQRRNERGAVQLRSHTINVSSRNLFARNPRPRFVEIAS